MKESWLKYILFAQVAAFIIYGLFLAVRIYFHI